MSIVSKIVTVSEWRSLTSLPSYPSNKAVAFDTEFGVFGVYQVALKSNIESIGTDIVNANIGYTGKSYNIHSRTYDIRWAATSTSGTHGAGRYIRQNDINPNDVVIRILYVSCKEEAHALETFIHDESQKLLGNRFAWREASAGKDGNLAMILDSIDTISLEDLKIIRTHIDNLAKERLFNEWNNN